MTELTAEFVRQRLTYNPETGELLWREGRRKGKTPGSRNTHGYIQILIGGRLHMAHRLIWLMVTGSWPLSSVDHMNGVPDDNRWDNLRAATHEQNMWNAKHRKDSGSPYKGIAKNGKRWKSEIRHKGSVNYLGTFDTPEEAHAAYCEAAARLRGPFARTA